MIRITRTGVNWSQYELEPAGLQPPLQTYFWSLNYPIFPLETYFCSLNYPIFPLRRIFARLSTQSSPCRRPCGRLSALRGPKVVIPRNCMLRLRPKAAPQEGTSREAASRSGPGRAGREGEVGQGIGGFGNLLTTGGRR